MPLRNSDLGLYREDQKFVFTEDEILLCPNGCGLMVYTIIRQPLPVPEAFAQCKTCKHQCLVADERPQRKLLERLPEKPEIPEWQQKAIDGLKERY
jgi:hypothetical protein